MKKILILLITGLLLTGCANAPDALNSVANRSIQAMVDSPADQKKQKKHKKKKGKRTSLVFKKEENSSVLAAAETAGLLNKKNMTQAIVGLGTAAVATMEIIGGKLAEYFTEQDKQNAVEVLEKTEKAKPVAWCSNSRNVSENVADVKCKKTHKIIQTPSPVTKKESKVCRSLKTEVVTESGEVKTETQNLCKNEKGEWYDESAD